MTKPAILKAHRHVSERETAHRWPNGAYDDFKWEDCTWCAGLMLARICRNAGIPATHLEAEHLRDDAGEDPLGGSGNDDLLRGFRRRFGWSPRWGTNPSGLWSILKPNTAAVIQVKMGGLPFGHPLRRWQPSFTGAHQLMIARVNDWDRVWIDDPLAPDGNYEGEYASKDSIFRLMNALSWPASFLYDTIIPPAAKPPAPGPIPAQKRVRVAPGHWWDYDASGTVGHYVIRRDPRQTDGFTASWQTLVKVNWGGEDRRLVKLTSGAYADRWVDLEDTGSVTELQPI